jgi:hypothetical protein
MSSAGRIGLFSASFQDSLISVNLVLLLLDDESERSYLFGAWIRAQRRLARIDLPCVLDLVLSYELAASVRTISIVVSSMLVTISVRGHHAVPSERWDQVIADLTQCERVDVIVFDA